MGLCNEGETMKRFKDALKRNRKLMRARAEGEAEKTEIGVNGANTVKRMTLFDAGLEGEQHKAMGTIPKSARVSVGGFETLQLLISGR